MELKLNTHFNANITYTFLVNFELFKLDVDYVGFD